MVRVLSGAVDRALAVRTRYVVVAAAWITYACLAPAGDRRRLPFASGESGLRIARTWFGLALVPFGTGHFAYLKFTAALVPAWLPFHTFVAAFTGAAFIAAALGVLSGYHARAAARLVTIQIVLTAGSWVVAESYGAPRTERKSDGSPAQ